MCLRYQGIDDNGSGVGGGRRARGLSDNDGNVGGGRGVDDVSKVLETRTKAEGVR